MYTLLIACNWTFKSISIEEMILVSMNIQNNKISWQFWWETGKIKNTCVTYKNTCSSIQLFALICSDSTQNIYFNI